MKTKKIITLVLSLVLLIGGIVAISASADEAEVSASVKVTTLNYGADIRIAYALQLAEGTSADDVVLKLYKTPDLSDTPAVAAFSGEYYGDTYPVYYSMGISAKDIADAVYAVPCNAENGEAVGVACRYSVAEYCHYNLANDVSADLKALSEDLLSYGASTQQRLINIGNLNAETEILIGDYNYVIAANDVITTDANGYKTRLFAPDEQVSFSYVGEGAVNEWKLSFADGSGVIVDAAEIEASYTGVTGVEPLFAVEKYGFEDGKISGANIEQHDLTVSPTLVSGAETPLESYDGTYIDFAVVEDPANAANKVLKAVMTTGGTKNARTIVNVSGDTNTADYVYEMKLYVAKPAAYGSSAYMYFDNSSVNQLFYLYLKTDENGVNIIDNGTLKETLATFDYDTWVTVRLELHTSVALEENRIKLYMGEEGQAKTLVRDFATCASASSAVGITRARIDYMRSFANTFYFDDFCLAAK